MKHLLDAFQKTEVSRESKLDVIMAIGEMFLNCGNLCLAFLPETMQLLIVACEASVNLNESERNYA